MCLPSQPYSVLLFSCRCWNSSLPHAQLRLAPNLQTHRLSDNPGSFHRRPQPFSRNTSFFTNSVRNCNWHQHYLDSNIPNISAPRVNGRSSWHTQSVVHYNRHPLRLSHEFFSCWCNCIWFRLEISYCAASYPKFCENLHDAMGFSVPLNLNSYETVEMMIETGDDMLLWRYIQHIWEEVTI